MFESADQLFAEPTSREPKGKLGSDLKHQLNLEQFGMTYVGEVDLPDATPTYLP